MVKPVLCGYDVMVGLNGLPSFIGYAPLIFWVYHLFSANVYHNYSMFFGHFGGISTVLCVFTMVMFTIPIKKYCDGMVQR